MGAVVGGMLVGLELWCSKEVNAGLIFVCLIYWQGVFLYLVIPFLCGGHSTTNEVDWLGTTAVSWNNPDKSPSQKLADWLPLS